jgi:oligopeptide/dipeptide ABC transporter ATP-binding protein
VTATDAAPLLEVSGLAKHFPMRDGLLMPRQAGMVKAVDDVSFAIGRGETLGLVGESGCGKSTTGRLVLRLIEASAGSVRFEGRDVLALPPAELRALRRSMQIVFQDPYGALDPRMSVEDIILEPLDVQGVLRRGDRAREARRLLDLVGLSARHATRYPHEFSGGQRQRIGIARAIAPSPKFVVCDEAVSALDVSVQAQIVNLLQDLQQELGLSYLFIAHDLAVVKHISDRVAVMYLGSLVEIAAKRDLYAAPRHPYTQALLAAIPVRHPRLRKSRARLSGEIPSALAPPAGCRFHGRCPIARERCATERPALREILPGHQVACHFAEETGPRPPATLVTAS